MGDVVLYVRFLSKAWQAVIRGEIGEGLGEEAKWDEVCARNFDIGEKVRRDTLTPDDLAD